MNYPTHHRGVPIPEAFVDVPEIAEAATWRQGVDHTLDYIGRESAKEIPVEIRALSAIINDNPASAARIIGDMSGKDRAVFTYYLTVLGSLIDAVDFRERIGQTKDIRR